VAHGCDPNNQGRKKGKKAKANVGRGKLPFFQERDMTTLKELHAVVKQLQWQLFRVPDPRNHRWYYKLVNPFDGDSYKGFLDDVIGVVQNFLDMYPGILDPIQKPPVDPEEQQRQARFAALNCDEQVQYIRECCMASKGGPQS
jgi:hypothetical protein